MTTDLVALYEDVRKRLEGTIYYDGRIQRLPSEFALPILREFAERVLVQAREPKPSPIEEYNLWCGCLPSERVCLRQGKWLHYAGATPCPTGPRAKQRDSGKERRMTDRRTGLFYGRRDYGGRRSWQNRKRQRRKS